MQIGNREYIKHDVEIVIGDIHGSIFLLKRLIKKLEKYLKGDYALIFTGDIPGNFNNLKVFKYIEELTLKYNVYIVEGNHDTNMINWMNGHDIELMDNVTQQLLEAGYPSGGRKDLARFLNDYNITFFKNMIPYYENEDIIVTHAPFVKHLEQYNHPKKGLVDNMLWHLQWEFEELREDVSYNFDKYRICGHQCYGPGMKRRVTPSLYKECAFIDCGAGYSEDSKLFALILPEKIIISS